MMANSNLACAVNNEKTIIDLAEEYAKNKTRDEHFKALYDDNGDTFATLPYVQGNKFKGQKMPGFLVAMAREAESHIKVTVAGRANAAAAAGVCILTSQFNLLVSLCMGCIHNLHAV
jgi:hypothetical protein